MQRIKTSFYSETNEHPNFKTFSGRNRELAQLIRGITDYSPASICIEGPTKIGASFLVSRMISLFKSKDELWRNSISHDNQNIQIFRIDCSPKTIKDVIDSIYEAVIINENDLENENVSDYDQRRLILRRLLQNTDCRYIFCLTNFEESIKKDKDIVDPGYKLITSLMDFHSFVFTVDRPIQEINFLADIRNLSTLRLGLFKSIEGYQYLHDVFGKSKNVKYLSDEIAELLLNLSGCHPYLLYQISEVYFWICQKNGLQEPTKLEESVLESLILDELHPAGTLYFVYNFFRDTWKILKEEEKEWLKNLIIQPENCSVNQENEQIIQNLGFLQLISYKPDVKSFSIASRLFSEYLQIYQLKADEEAPSPNTISEVFDTSTRIASNKEDKLYNLFLSKPNEVISNEEISREIYGIETPNKAEIHKINTLVGRLRNRLSDQIGGSRTDLIRSVYGKGFRFSYPSKS
jgi:hypothetical protein